MTRKQIAGRIVIVLLVVGLLAAAGYALYRLGYSEGAAGFAAAPWGRVDDLREFRFERGPGFRAPGFPFGRFPPLPPRPFDRGGFGLGFPLLSLGALLLTAGVTGGLIVVLVRWIFRPDRPRSDSAASPQDASGKAA